MTERTPVEFPDDELTALADISVLLNPAVDSPLRRALARCHKAWQVEHPNLASGEHPAQAPPDAGAAAPLAASAPVVECCGCGHVNEAWARRSSWCEGCNGWYGGPSGVAA